MQRLLREDVLLFHAAFIEGRCASIVKDNQEIGFFGELHPRTIQVFELEHPIIAFEIQADLLQQGL